MKKDRNNAKKRRSTNSDMKKVISLTGVILLGCVMISVFFAPQGAAQTGSTADFVIEESSANEEIFLIKAENNRIIVYRQGESMPYLTTETMVSGLPESDIFRLQKGIEVCGKENLRKALEDYCS